MSQIEKLVIRLRAKPKDFTFSELVKVLRHFGYSERKTGKASGSRRAFVNNLTMHIIRIHKPHPGNILKSYQIDYLIDELKNEEYL